MTMYRAYQIAQQELYKETLQLVIKYIIFKDDAQSDQCHMFWTHSGPPDIYEQLVQENPNYIF